VTPERWAEIEELFHRVAECEPKQRAKILEQAGDGDAELRREVEALLASDASASGEMQAAVRSGLDAVNFPLVGVTMSHYSILEGLGGGGMGLVYRAEDIMLGRQVALKFLPEESIKDPAARGRFEREARSASALEHPNICPIHEFGEHEGQPFLVMQLLEGQTLRELISEAGPDQPPMQLPKLLDLAVQITDGLDAAHRHGIIHRDIKPANIFVTSGGQVKILDFGLAKLAGGEPTEEESGSDPREAGGTAGNHETALLATPDPLLSKTGVAMGTAGYMSPEQARGEKLDARTDLFSFGLVLYEMATGKRAFKGETGPALHEAILKHDLTPVRRWNPSLPGRLDHVISKALKKNRQERYQSTAEIRADLLGLKRQLESRSSSRRWIAATVAALALLAVAGKFWFARRQPLSGENLAQVKFRQLTINSIENPVTSGSISPDGKFLAYVDQQGMHVKDLETGATRAAAQPDGLAKGNVIWELQDAAWLPDSTRFVANAHPASEGQEAWALPTTAIWLFDRQGSPPRKLREGAAYWAVLWDGAISFATDRERESWVMGPEGELAHKLFESEENTAAIGPVGQSFADRNVVLYGQHDSLGDSLLTRDLRGGPPVTIFTAEEMKKIRGDVAWLHDGRLIYQIGDPGSGFTSLQDSCNFWTMQIDTHTGKPREKPQRLTNWTGLCAEKMNFTADDKHLTFLRTSAHGTGYLAELGGSGTRVLNSRHFTLEEADDAITDWTADGKTAVLISNRGDHYEVYKQPLTADAPQLLATISGGMNEQATLTPDGKWIIVQTYPLTSPAELNQIARVPIDGGPPEPILRIRELSGGISCARPPSNRCVLAEISEGNRKMVVSEFDAMKGRGAELARFDFDPKFDPKLSSAIWNISPDGTRFAFSRGPAGPIEVRSFNNHSPQLIRPKGAIDMLNLYWTADGREFYFANRSKDGMELLHMDPKGNTKVLWKNNGRTFGIPSPDGRYLAIYDLKQNANMWMMENF
jgi:serine/threonine protein kinase